MYNKILTLDELAHQVAILKQQQKRVVLCHGTFDLVHMGHIRHLQAARKEGDVLVCTITADEHVNKGPGRPIFTEGLRAENLAALECVDYVAVNYEVTAVNVLHALKPDIYVKGSDYKVASEDITGNINHEKQAVEQHGGRIHFTDDIVFSSTRLLNEYFDVFTEETKLYLNQFKRDYSPNDVIQKIQSLKNLKVLVVGDAIIDQYYYTDILGQTGKSNIIAVKYRDKEQFAGGAIAVANHIAGFADNVTLLTMLGKTHSFEEYIRSKLNTNIQPAFFYSEDAPTTVKRRFVDGDLNKLFEVYYFEDAPLVEALDQAICDWLDAHIQEYDAVVVPDFGNGFITQRMIDLMTRKARYLAVNTQINSGNRGYHTIHRYPVADFVSLNEPELRLAAHNRHDSLEKVVAQVGETISPKVLAVTRGVKGLYLKDRTTDQDLTIPILSTRVVDRIGAGDAFLSLTSICLANQFEPQLAGFIGAVAAALDVQIVCNREPVDPILMFKYITTLLK